jgi:organic radical activating enzyme
MIYPITEIFYSIQGEGFHTGKPATFIRFSGCNAQCPFCDTDFTKKEELSTQQIIEQINPECDFVVLTGGEPSIHNLFSICEALKKAGKLVAIETNGTNYEHIYELYKQELLTWVTFSPKPMMWKTATDPSSSYGKMALLCNEIKIVFDGVVDPDFYTPLVTPQLLRGCAFIQPCSEDFEPAVAYVLKNPLWRLSVQTQKVIKVL